jgi:hypothetical protein
VDALTANLQLALFLSCPPYGVLGKWKSTKSQSEPITDSANRSIVGAGLGGSLAEPVKNYPSLFSVGGIFDKFPYLLPNVVCAIFVLVSVIVGLLFLEETHEDKRDRRDAGVELGRFLLRKIGFGKETVDFGGLNEESVSFLNGDEKAAVAYSSTESSPRTSSVRTSTTEIDPTLRRHLQEAPKKSLSWRRIFSRQIVLNIASLGFLAL